MPGLRLSNRLQSFRDSLNAEGQARDPNRYFSTNKRVQEYFALIAARGSYPDPDDPDSARADYLFDKIVNLVLTRKLQLDYSPDPDGRIRLPAGDGVDYLQAVLFWCAHFNTSIPRLVEAHARAGDGASAAEIRAMLKKISEEDEISRTDTFVFGGARPERR